MSASSLEAEIIGFLKSPPIGSTLLMTTFGLNERVLVELLRKANVPIQQKIVVAHDVYRRNNPGYLKYHYPNSTVITIALSTTDRHGVPAFHAKLWGYVKSDQSTFIRLAISSINLTETHLAKSANSLESWHKLHNVSFANSKTLRSFIKNNTANKNEISRRDARASTFIVDARNKLDFSIIEDEKPVSCLLAGIKFSARWMQTPFASINAKKFISNGNPDRISKYPLTGDSAFVHAKIYGNNDLIISGSFNCTSQALGIDHSCKPLCSPINTECVLLIPLSEKISANPDYHITDSAEYGFDEIPDGSNWTSQRNFAAKAPEQVEIQIENDNVFIAIDHHKPVTTTSISIGESVPKYKLKKTSTSKRHLLLCDDIISALIEGYRNHGGVVIHGWNGKIKSWEKELDFGILWQLFEKDPGAASNRKISVNLGRLADSGKKSHRQEDVREIRKIVLDHYRDFSSTSISHESNQEQLLLLLLRFKLISSGKSGKAPDWCINIAKRKYLLAGVK